MKIFISIDIEGICGITSRESTRFLSDEYYISKKLMTRELNSVVKILFNNGVKEIVVSDSHGSKNNLIVDELDHRISLITGSKFNKKYNMMEGIDSTFDGCIFLGYHSRRGTINGFLNHTMSSKTVRKFILNEEEIGEGQFNANLAWNYNVPILLISGDDICISQIKKYIVNIETVTTKKSINSEVAINLPWSKVEEEYKKNISLALKKENHYFNKKKDYIMEIEFQREDIAEILSRFENINRKDAYTINFKKSNFIDIYEQTILLVKIANLLPF